MFSVLLGNYGSLSSVYGGKLFTKRLIMRGGVAGMQTIRESTRAWGKSEMKTFSTFCEGTQPLKTTLLGGTWRNRNTPTSLSSCQGFPDASRGKELIDAAPGVSLPGPRGAGWECRLTAQIGPKGHPLIVCMCLRR